MMKRMVKDDTAVFHAFAWNHVTVQYDDWRGMPYARRVAPTTLPSSKNERTYRAPRLA
jgi:hypothetical protein